MENFVIPRHACPYLVTLLQRQFWLKDQKIGYALFHEISTPNTQIYCMLLKIAYLSGEVVGGGEGEREISVRGDVSS